MIVKIITNTINHNNDCVVNNKKIVKWDTTSLKYTSVT